MAAITEQAEAGAMPTQNGLGLHEDNHPPPRRQPPRTEKQWRIVDDATWFAVHTRCTTREPTRSVAKKPAATHALTGLGRCANCGGGSSRGAYARSVVVQNRPWPTDARGTATAAARCVQSPSTSKAEVEAAEIDQLQTYVLGDEALAMVLGQVRVEIEAQLPQRQSDIAALEAELATVRAEQKRLAKAIALSDEVPELVLELQQRSARIRNLEAQLLAARRTPAELAALVDRVEENVRANIRSLREAVADRVDVREVFHTMFPSGLTFEAARTPDGARLLWKISGDADFAKLLWGKRSDRGFEWMATPTGFEPVLLA